MQGQGQRAPRRWEGLKAEVSPPCVWAGSAGWCEHSESRVVTALTDHKSPPGENQRCIHRCVSVPWLNEGKRKGGRTKGKGGKKTGRKEMHLKIKWD